jgi:hypothetical protein
MVSTLEPVSGQVGLCFPGKVILGGRDRTAITSVEAEGEKSRDQVDRVERANTGLFGAAPGNLRRAATDWSSNEDSNQGPGRFYRRRATGTLRDRGRSRTGMEGCRHQHRQYQARQSLGNGYIESFTPVFATNSSTTRCSTRYAKRKPVSRVGGVTTTVSDRARPRCSWPRSPRGWLG